jgi:diphosphomevalonate decarboxylase
VELHSAGTEEDAYAETLFPPDHWDLVDVIAVVDTSHKEVSSSDGHRLADTSPLQSARLADSSRRLDFCRQALAEHDFALLANITELDSNLMHAVMMTSTPALLYWQPATVAIMLSIGRWRQEGLEVCYTIDAGPNVHCICSASSVEDVQQRLASLNGILQTYAAKPGPAAILLSS